MAYLKDIKSCSKKNSNISDTPNSWFNDLSYIQNSFKSQKSLKPSILRASLCFLKNAFII